MAVKRAYTDTEIDAIRLARWRCRTDLGYLCREVLGYKDVDDRVHGPIMRTLQQFPKPKNKREFEEHDTWDGKKWSYTPLFKHVQELEGRRRRLILAHRGIMKTTLNLQAHPIQWILNYPSVALAIFQSNLDKSEDILKSVRHHFRYNEVFRRLFPEHCPHSKIDEWGLKSEFTTNARPRSESRREPTMKALSIDKENAGYHFDVMKFSDIVEPGTTKTDSAMDNTRREFSLAESLLVSPVYWIDVEGTRYTAREMYQDLLDRWELERKKNLDHQYEILVQGCYKRQDPVTKKEQTTFTPDTLDWDYLLDEKGRKCPWWERDAAGAPRFTLAVLEAKERDDPYDFSCQYLIKPQAGEGGKETFPLTSLQRISLANYKKNVAPRVKFFTIALDSAQSNNNRSNHSVFTVLAWDAAGRAILVETVRKKLLPDELTQELLRLNEKYRPRFIVIEDTPFIDGLKPHIEDEVRKRQFQYQTSQIPWNVEYVKPDNTKSKTERIRSLLQPVFVNKNLLFVYPDYNQYIDDGFGGQKPNPVYSEESVDTYEALLREFRTFPLGSSDDILDSLSIHFQQKSWYGRLGKRSIEDMSSLQQSVHLKNLLFAQIGVDPVFSGGTPFPTGTDHFIPPEHFRPSGGN